MDDASGRDIASDGARLFKGALKRFGAELEDALARLPADEAGVRIRGCEGMKQLLASDGCIGAIAATVLGRDAKPVRAVLFNKTPATNWSLGWHQDRVICVRERIEVPGFGPWTVKQGMPHVEPPFGLIARMVTVRAHLDEVSAANAPLLIAPGSHRLGRIPIEDVPDVVRRCGSRACLAEAGDIWLYDTSILHASERAAAPKARRVLQVDFAAEALPNRLEWMGV